MLPIALACVALPVTALLYGLLGLRRRDGRRYRMASERCAALVVDPYYAAAARWWPEDDTQAAAARLLLAGLATVNRRGNLSLTEDGTDPARTAGHPLPDALLAALRRRTAPAAIGRIVLRDTAFRTAREGFHTAYRAGLPPSPPAPRRDLGCLGVFGVLLLVMEISFTSAALLDTAPRGPEQWAASAATALTLVAQIAWFGRYDGQRDAAGPRDPLAERLARAGLHPALAELASQDPESADRLRTSRLRTRRSRNRGRPRRRSTPTGAGA
ncbi:hypothetical protein V7793_00405 [Streptomyces sp. KLMMK]|uniref:hypothetical protein n=1 Tax=Streptomyces sp. KLMMK TaxID=3109353 RepID=UPI002FFE120B